MVPHLKVLSFPPLVVVDALTLLHALCDPVVCGLVSSIGRGSSIRPIKSRDFRV